MRLRISILMLFCFVNLIYVPIYAQSELQESEKSVVVFDLQLQKLRDNDLVKSLDAEKVIQQLQAESRMNEFDVNKVVRIFGSISAPKSLGAFEEIDRGGDIPLNFFVRIQFVDKASASGMLDKIKEASEVLEKNGKTYFKPKQGTGPGNLLAYSVNATTVEVGTDKYVMMDTRKVFTDALTKRWDVMPNQAIRLAVDLDSAREFIDEALAAAEQNLPDEAGMFLDLVNKTSALQLSIDLDSKNLITLIATGTDDDGTMDLQNGIEAVLGLARFAAKNPVAQMSKESPEVGKVAGEIVAALKTNKQDNDISLVIPKPEGFEEAVGIAAKQAQGAAEKAKQTNDFKQYALGVLNYHDTFRGFPIGVDEASGKSENLSWRVRILPFIEQVPLYDRMDMKEAWDGERNKQFVDQMPKIYGADGKNASVCWVVPKIKPKNFADITDGTSNTIMLIQNPKPVPWMQPTDVTIDEAIEIVSELMDGEQLIVAFYDGSVRRISKKIDKETLRKLFDPSDGQPVDTNF